MTPTNLTTLPDILQQMLDIHERMLEVAAAQRCALAAADAHTFEQLAAEHAALAQSAANLDRQRQALCTASPDHNGCHRHGSAWPCDTTSTSPPQSLSTAIAQLPEPTRLKTLDLATRLKAILLRLHHEHAVLRSAASSMLAHIDGLARHVARALGHAGTYNHKGAVPHANLTLSAIDLKL